MRFFGALSLCLLISSCASLSNYFAQKKVCNTEYAYELGKQDATKGHVGKPGLAQSHTCQGEYSSFHFEHDYSAGFKDQKITLCAPESISKMGSQDAKIDYASRGSLNVLRICYNDDASKAQVTKQYQSAFSKTFCRSSNLSAAARKEAKLLREFDSDQIAELIELYCPRKGRSKLLRSFADGYDKQIKITCSAPSMYGLGAGDAKSSNDSSARIGQLASCPGSLQDSALNAYTKGFNETKHAIMKERELKLKQKQLDQELALQKAQIEAIRGQNKTNFDVPYSFVYNGKKLTASCDVDDFKNKASIRVYNHADFSCSLNGKWQVEFFERDGMPHSGVTKRKHMHLWSKSSKQFTLNAPSNARHCKARFAKW